MADIDAAMSVYGAVDVFKVEEVIVNVGGGDRLRETEDDADIDDRGSVSITWVAVGLNMILGQNGQHER